MIKSMTGFGRCEKSSVDCKFIVEMKAVNHRYLDINLKMPKKFNFFETSIRNLLKKYIQRGKIDLFITYEDFTEKNVSLRYNANIAQEYLQYFSQMSEQFGLDNDIRISGLSRYPEVLILEEQQPDEKKIWEVLEQSLIGASEQLVQTRITEGDNLRTDIFNKLQVMLEQLDVIEERSPQMLSDYRNRLESKVTELLADTQIEQSRVATELVIYADKICVDEELVRLKSHIDNMRVTLLQGEGIGRKLDFIAQEMNREANTILSKANDLEISYIAIDVKTDIEKIREQIQNIE